VELVNEADGEVQRARDALLGGDLEATLAHLELAIAMDRDHAAAHLQLGVALKLRGDREEARTALMRARELDPEGPGGAEAERILETFPTHPASGAGSGS